VIKVCRLFWKRIIENVAHGARDCFATLALALLNLLLNSRLKIFRRTQPNTWFISKSNGGCPDRHVTGGFLQKEY
jgi:hypothetical protein